MGTAIQLVFFLYILVPLTVCDEVFKLVNSSVQLDIPEHLDKSFDLFWTFNKDINIVRYIENSPTKVFDRYKDRVEFNEKTYSLTLKNLQKSDSGIYEAKEFGDRSVTVATYQLKVLDPVEKPVLTASLQSNDTCNVTLTCEAQNLSVTSHCYNESCDMTEKKTSGDTFHFLSLYVNKSFIICNHSNPVSWKNDTMEIKHVKQLCPPEEIKPKETSGQMKKILINCAVIFLVIFLVIIIISVFRWLKKKAICQNRKTDAVPDSVNTIYEEVDAKNKGGKKAESVEMSENHATPSTVYYTVGMPVPTCSNDESTGMDIKKENPSDSKFYKTHQNEGGQWNADSADLPQTIYSTVNKAGKTCV
ncbi:SLAM family member 9-like isoform X2 [Tachysurus vachellii]|uniref:SLAM family member 9-like isoform X2 n=1 Tax=Tachysurus vachellii TaxID=175792 RepID=UPI00296A96C5|nr:SLAM family member 9-like isoform X2 [Tachysurus vachellii]